MAALDRRNLNLDDFVGLNWSCWVDGVNISPPDAGCNTEGYSKYWRTRSDTMTLMKEDMHIYGHCPARDEIFLVVCSHCGQVVKPQAFEGHCERRHSPLPKMCGRSSSLPARQTPHPGRPSLNLSISKEEPNDVRSHEDSAASSAALPVHQHRSIKDTVSFPSIKKLPQEAPRPLPLQSSSMPQPRVPSWHSGPLPPGNCSSSTSPPERPSEQKPTAGQSQSPLWETRTYCQINKNIDEKECDLKKHCRDLGPKRKKLCRRELLCNSDSMQQQQKALGRTGTFNQLVVEPRTASVSAGQNMEQLPAKSNENPQHLETLEDIQRTQGSKYNFNSSCHVFGRSRGPWESFAEKEGDSTMKVDVHPPYPFNQTLLSSDDDDDEDAKREESTDLPATPWHPKPLGLCTFGCHTLGCSIFTFDRRWHHLRFALSSMLDHHVGSHLWNSHRKMPRVPKGLRSRDPIVGSPVRTGVRLPKSFRTLSLDSTSLGQLRQNCNTHSTKPPSSTAPESLSPEGCQRNVVGLCSSAQSREAELIPDESSEDKSSRYIRDLLLNEKGQPHTPSSQGPVNGLFSYGQKPCPPLQLFPLSRGRSPKIQQKVMDCDRTGPAQRRKGRNKSMLLSSVSTTSTCKPFSSPPHSSL
ncbi:ataxin-7-like protein 2b isoform X1 [Labrus mixtus]|uniref:ataxin-7-like protein 2b isoform X1 n=2 Tax=Labrus mixtus TaxID=508554 RepID=UPI0029C02E3E|nr:ataxin-7-like protein 2b isoform X1 [Labrus mixtus]